MGKDSESGSEESFIEYILSEYSIIAEAHFKTITEISVFFKHYLVIMSIPVAVIGYLLSQSTDRELTNIINNLNPIVYIIPIIIAVAGLLVLCYIINLRCDAILYARTMNAIRGHFYKTSKLDTFTKLRLRTLPKISQQPRYFELCYFGPVVVVFALINSLYLCLGLYCLALGNITVLSGIFTLSFLLLHMLCYWLYAHWREHGYLTSFIIGVDIDGVLNKHRKQFCRILKKNTGINLNEDDIVVIPVHEDERYRAKITKDHEYKVFNDPLYWFNMPALVNEELQQLKSLRNIFNMRIHMFTYRPWPECVGDGSQNTELVTRITEFLKHFRKHSLRLLPLKLWIKLEFLHGRFFIDKFIKPLKELPLHFITKEWLNEHGIVYDRLFFEKGNDYSSDPRGKTKNRFYKTALNNIRFFVEDDLEKANKLSYICDVVFLYKQPYNRPSKKIKSKAINSFRRNLPQNIIIVENWHDIFSNIRKLL